MADARPVPCPVIELLSDGVLAAKVVPRKTTNKTRIAGLESREGQRYRVKNETEITFGSVSCRVVHAAHKVIPKLSHRCCALAFVVRSPG